ncbi:MAG: DUF4174 domain-containing protein [Paracoccaceae bacterium]
MKQLLSLITLVFLALGAGSANAEGDPPLDIRNAGDVTLVEFLWLNRLIVVFADSELDPAFQKQLALLQDRAADLTERDVVVIADFDPASPSDIRNTLRPRGFNFVLIDKDGVVKLRKATPWDTREISRSIDKTDLRQQELRDARAGGS